MSKMKISVITSRYAISGVPLAQQRFACALSSYGHHVEFIISHLHQVDKQPDIENVKVRVFNKVRAIQMLFPLVRYFRRFKPDVVFTAGDHLNVIVTLAVIISRSKTKISASSRVTPYDTYSHVAYFYNELAVLNFPMNNVLKDIKKIRRQLVLIKCLNYPDLLFFLFPKIYMMLDKLRLRHMKKSK